MHETGSAGEETEEVHAALVLTEAGGSVWGRVPQAVMAGCTQRCQQGLLKFFQCVRRLISGTLSKGSPVSRHTPAVECTYTSEANGSESWVLHMQYWRSRKGKNKK